MRCNLVAALTVAAIAAAAQGQPSFRALGEPSGASSSVPQGISADGKVVVGYASGRPTRWTAETGTQFLPLLPGATEALARGVSGDGTLVVGTATTPSGYRACLWTADGAVVNLSDRPGLGTMHSANAISRDGSTIVGGGIYFGYPRAMWMTLTGSPQILGPFAAERQDSSGLAVSGDGSVIAGLFLHGSWRREPYRWTAEEGMVGLGLGPGPFVDGAYVRDMSEDGRAVVGYALAITGQNFAFRWTAETGLVELPPPPGATYSYALAVNGDGSMVLGELSGGLGDPERAGMWDQTHGWRFVEDVLRELGLEQQLEGWTLEAVFAVTPDGRYIVGTGQYEGRRPLAWIADLGGGACRADLTGDGMLDFADYLAFLGLYDVADPAADFNGDGLVDFSDYLEFLELYEQGC